MRFPSKLFQGYRVTDTMQNVYDRVHYNPIEREILKTSLK